MSIRIYSDICHFDRTSPNIVIIIKSPIQIPYKIPPPYPLKGAVMYLLHVVHNYARWATATSEQQQIARAIQVPTQDAQA